MKTKKDPIIKDVFDENFDVEMKKISSLIDKYNYISLDTEFPGFVYNGQGKSQKEIYYNAIKSNVDCLKLIQVGLTLCDKDGNYPKDTATWQINFHFDLNKDVYSSESIDLLHNSGIDFKKLLNRGVQMDRFAEWLTSSGLILNDDITWISFHGAYDFAYLLKILTNLLLPNGENEFLDLAAVYFPNFYDVRYLVKKDNFRGSLSKLAQGLDINRIGTQHQAGSDSIVTSEIFFRLRKINDFDDIFGKNILFCMGIDDNDFFYPNQNSYTTVNNIINNNVYNITPKMYPYEGINNLNQVNPQLNPLNQLNQLNQFNPNINPINTMTPMTQFNNINNNYPNPNPYGNLPINSNYGYVPKGYEYPQY